MPAPSACARLLGQRREQRRVEEAGSDRHHPDPAPGEVTRGGQGHRDDPALGGGVGDLPDLAVEGGDRGGVDADAALACLVGLIAAHRGRRQAQHVEGPDQVDPDHVREVFEVVGAGLVRDPLGPADPGAADRDPEPSVDRRGPLDRGRNGVGIGDVGLDEPGADLLGERGPRSGSRSAMTTVAPAVASDRAVAAPRPEAPPATSAPAPSTRIGPDHIGRAIRPARVSPSPPR